MPGPLRRSEPHGRPRFWKSGPCAAARVAKPAGRGSRGAPRLRSWSSGTDPTLMIHQIRPASAQLGTGAAARSLPARRQTSERTRSDGGAFERGGRKGASEGGPFERTGRRRAHRRAEPLSARDADALTGAGRVSARSAVAASLRVPCARARTHARRQENCALGKATAGCLVRNCRPCPRAGGGQTAAKRDCRSARRAHRPSCSRAHRVRAPPGARRARREADALAAVLASATSSPRVHLQDRPSLLPTRARLSLSAQTRAAPSLQALSLQALRCWSRPRTLMPALSLPTRAALSLQALSLPALRCWSRLRPLAIGAACRRLSPTLGSCPCDVRLRRNDVAARRPRGDPEPARRWQRSRRPDVRGAASRARARASV